MSEEQHNDPLEEFFQKKAREYDISYREEDWNALEERLDKVDARRASSRRWQMAAAAAFLLVALLGYFTYQNYRQINSLNRQLSQNEQVIEAPLQDRPADTGDESQAPKAGENTGGDITQDQSTGKEPVKQAVSSEERGPTKESPDRETAKFADYNRALVSLGDTCPTCGLSSMDQITTVDYSIIRPADTRGLAESSPSEPMMGMDEEAYGTQSAVSARRSGTPGTAVGLVVGPDLSTVGSVSNFRDPGYKIGITVDYSLNRNWAISVGAIHSRVRYTAKGDEYRPPSGYWNYGVQASKTIGECFLIDIPVNISYRFLHFNRSRLYASAGLSSYIMLNEDYRFRYDTNQSGLPQRWQEKTGTTHFMSNANLSIGYEYDVGGRISLRAEPFIRLPIKEVGWGNVNLYSMGTLVSLNYRFN